ncbi:MAG: hypothetical protein IJ872_01695 [Eubacterium sp.]|nr:hypothetical protein [Eubacterium sp.]
MKVEDNKCPVCGNTAETLDYGNKHKYVNCNVCGYLYVRTDDSYKDEPKDMNKLASYLFYNGKLNTFQDDEEFFFNMITNDETYKAHKKEFRHCGNVNDSIVESWFPKTFNEKVDMFLLGLSQKQKHMGQAIFLSNEECYSALFVKRYKANGDLFSRKDQLNQANFLIGYLKESELVDSSGNQFMILPKGLSRIDDLEKQQPDNKNVFVAMSFADDMASVREAIKAAITVCGYIPRIMDEIEHNHQIVPEMLYEIRQAKFVIAELTGHNNGAYFEAGYALGQGKDVIQLCKEDTFGTDGHFDVKQVSTILWEDEADLTQRLINRIKATIE